MLFTERVVTTRYRPNNLKMQYNWEVYDTGFPLVTLGLISTLAIPRAMSLEHIQCSSKLSSTHYFAERQLVCPRAH